MTSPQHCRFALWHHKSQMMALPIVWRVTPRSKAYVAIVPPTVLPGAARVVSATPAGLQLQLTEAQINMVHTWVSRLPDEILRPSVCDTGTLVHNGPYTVIGANMSACKLLPTNGSSVNVRLTADVHKIGPLYKTVIRVVDVLSSDVATI